MQRSLLIFENSLKSLETRKTYLYYVDDFISQFDLKDYDDLASTPQDKLQIMVEDYVMYLKKKLSPNIISVPICALKAFLDCSDVELRWGKINRLKPTRVKKTGKEAWLTSEIQKMLSFTSELRTKTVVHFLAASGIRIGALDGLKMKHISQIEDCKCITVYEGEIEEYVTFLTPEASCMFDEYVQKRESNGEKITPESPAFRSTYQLGYAKVAPMNMSSVKELMRLLVLKSGLRANQVKIGKRYNKQVNHAFRKRFNTIMKTTNNMNISLAEKMMGHSVTVQMDNVYLDPSVEQLFTEYKKAIPQLTIDETIRQQIKLEQKEKENSELQKQVDEIKSLKEDMESVKLRGESVVSVTDPEILKILQSKEFKKMFNEKLKSKS